VDYIQTPVQACTPYNRVLSSAVRYVTNVLQILLHMIRHICTQLERVE